MQTTVSSKDGLKNAVSANLYEKIIITGPYAQEVAKSIDNNKKGDLASNVAIGIGALFAWPVLAAGIVGKIATNDLKKYKIYSVKDNEVVLIIEEKYKKKLKG